MPCRIGGKCISESDLCDGYSYKIVYKQERCLVVLEGNVSRKVTCAMGTHIKLFINRRGALSYRRDMYLGE